MEERSLSPRATLSKLELRCPPLPQTLMEAMDLIDQPEKLEVGPVTEMVQRDPIVVARLLQIVNSAYYGLRHAISSADRAVVMLGPVAVAGIVVGMNMLKLRSMLDGPAAQCFLRLIRHSVATAFLARHLLDQDAPRSMARIGVGFTSGLLHDFGKIILVYNFPEEAVKFYDMQALDQQVTDEDERHLEQLLFGCDHTEAGEYVARKLSFPDTLTDVIRLHHEPDRPTDQTETDRVVRAVAVANLATKAMGYAFTKDLSWERCVEAPVWSAFAHTNSTRYADEVALLEDMQAQQEHLDQYVHELTSASNPDRLHSRMKAHGGAP